LLGGPFGAGIRGNVEVNDLPPVVTQHDEDVQDTEGHGRNREKVAGRDVGNVIVQKRPPGLRRRFPSADHVLGHGLFGDVVAQHGQFGYDPRYAPGRVLPGHAANQVTDFAFDGRASGFAGPGFPPPIQVEALVMPPDDRFGLDEDQGRSSVWPEAPEPYPEDAVAGPQFRAFDRLLEHRHLLSQCEVLDGGSSAAHDEGPEE